MEQLQGSFSIPEQKDSRGVILYWDRTTPDESFSPGIELLHGSLSVLGQNDSKGVIM